MALLPDWLLWHYCLIGYYGFPTRLVIMALLSAWLLWLYCLIGYYGSTTWLMIMALLPDWLLWINCLLGYYGSTVWLVIISDLLSAWLLWLNTYCLLGYCDPDVWLVLLSDWLLWPWCLLGPVVWLVIATLMSAWSCCLIGYCDPAVWLVILRHDKLVMTFAKTIFTAIQKPFPTELLQYLNRKVIHYKNKWSTEMPAMYLPYFRRINNDRIHIFVAKYLFLLDVLGWMCKHVDAVFRDCFCLKIQKSWRYFVRWAWAWVRVWCTSISMSMNISMSPPPPR